MRRNSLSKCAIGSARDSIGMPTPWRNGSWETWPTSTCAFIAAAARRDPGSHHEVEHSQRISEWCLQGQLSLHRRWCRPDGRNRYLGSGAIDLEWRNACRGTRARPDLLQLECVSRLHRATRVDDVHRALDRI